MGALFYFRTMWKITFNWFKSIEKDPVKHCEVYKSFGCSHVDGIGCKMSTCTIREELKKCVGDLHYFMTKYILVNGEPFTTTKTKEEINETFQNYSRTKRT